MTTTAVWGESFLSSTGTPGAGLLLEALLLEEDFLKSFGADIQSGDKGRGYQDREVEDIQDISGERCLTPNGIRIRL